MFSPTKLTVTFNLSCHNPPTPMVPVCWIFSKWQRYQKFETNSANVLWSTERNNNIVRGLLMLSLWAGRSQEEAKKVMWSTERSGNIVRRLLLCVSRQKTGRSQKGPVVYWKEWHFSERVADVICMSREKPRKKPKKSCDLLKEMAT